MFKYPYVKEISLEVETQRLPCVKYRKSSIFLMRRLTEGGAYSKTKGFR